jgi:hypothetical protein
MDEQLARELEEMAEDEVQAVEALFGTLAMRRDGEPRFLVPVRDPERLADRRRGIGLPPVEDDLGLEPGSCHTATSADALEPMASPPVSADLPRRRGPRSP